MVLSKLTLLRAKRNMLNKIDDYYVNEGIMREKNDKKNIIEKDYVAPPSYLWSFVDDSKQKRKSKRYVKNRKKY